MQDKQKLIYLFKQILFENKTNVYFNRKKLEYPNIFIRFREHDLECIYNELFKINLDFDFICDSKNDLLLSDELVSICLCTMYLNRMKLGLLNLARRRI